MGMARRSCSTIPSNLLAHDDIEATKDWHEEIWKALRACDAFVGLVTEEFNDSAWCQQEVGAALALNKPRLLVRLGPKDPPGFAGRFQGAKRAGLLKAIDKLDAFQALRVETWIRAVAAAPNWIGAEAVHDRFHGLWASMPEDKKLRWLLAAAGNGEAAGQFRQPPNKLLREPVKKELEARESAPFFREAFAELKSLLTHQWLFDHDKSGVLHDPDDNPISKQPLKMASR